MSVHSKIVTFFRKTIAQSGQILDDDVIYLNSEDWYEKKEKKSTPIWLIMGSIICGIYSILQRKIEIFYASAVLTAVPLMTPYMVALYYDCHSRTLKKNLEELLEEFRVFSRCNTERIDFLNSYKKYLETSGKPFITLSTEAVLDLFEKSSKLQSSIINLMLDIISELQIGLEDFVFDWNEYADALSQELKYDTVESCFRNANILDARFLLIRSHFWISVYLLCTKKGNPQLLVQVMEQKIPDLLSLIRKSNSQMKDALDKIRFFEKDCLVQPPKHLLRLGPKSSTSRVRRDVISLNNNICCTLLNAKKLSIMTDDDNLEDLLDELGEALSKAARNIYECYESACDLKKSIEVLNRQKNNISELTEEKAQNETITVNNEELEEESKEVKEMAEEEDQEFEAFTTEEPQRDVASVGDDTTADDKLIIEQQSRMIRELRKHVKFLEKKQNLDARLMNLKSEAPQSDKTMEISSSSIHTSSSSIKLEDGVDHSSEKPLNDPSSYSMESKEEEIEPQCFSENSYERARMEMVQQMRMGLGVRRNLKVFSTDNRAMGFPAPAADGLHNILSRFRQREEDTFE